MQDDGGGGERMRPDAADAGWHLMQAASGFNRHRHRDISSVWPTTVIASPFLPQRHQKTHRHKRSQETSHRIEEGIKNKKKKGIEKREKFLFFLFF